ncbi:MAG: hypothetical protein ABR587_10070 [Candidatus Binatia bacterium]
MKRDATEAGVARAAAVSSAPTPVVAMGASPAVKSKTSPGGKAAATPAVETTAAPAAAWLQTIAGRLGLVAAFTVLLAVTNAIAWPVVGLFLAVLSLLPQHRRTLLALATVAVVLVSPPVGVEQLAALGSERGAAALASAWPVVVLAIIAFGCLFVELVRRRPKSLVGRRPVLVLLVLLTAMLVGGGSSLQGPAWFVVTASAMALGSYVWFFAYAASESRLRGAPPAVRQLGYWRPFWGFSNVPIGKGAAYLERVEARDAEQLAVSQLAGLRLMAWAAVLTFAMDGFRLAVYAPHGEQAGMLAELLFWLPAAGMPPIAAVLESQVQGVPLPFATRWAAVVSEFMLTVLHMMTWGHAIIATCRMAGYNAAPNTDWALLSTSVAEFYNRFYFYFKELLATFFFYPTYLRYFRSRPKLRLFVATFMAAGFGNFLFHFYRDSHEIFRLGFWDALVAYRVYGCYAAVLGVSIAVSQMRLLARRREKPRGIRRVLATAGVLFFYCLLGVLDVRTPHALADYGRLYVSLFVP